MQVFSCRVLKFQQPWSGFQSSVDSNSRLPWDCFTSLCDWLKNLVKCFDKSEVNLLQLAGTRFPALDADYMGLRRRS